MRAVAIVAMAAPFCFSAFWTSTRASPFAGPWRHPWSLWPRRRATLLRPASRQRSASPRCWIERFVDVAILTALLYLTGGARNRCALLPGLVLCTAPPLPPRLAVGTRGRERRLLRRAAFLPCRAAAADLDDVDGQFDLRAQRSWLTPSSQSLIAWFGIRLSALRRSCSASSHADAEKNARERYTSSAWRSRLARRHENRPPLSTISVLVNDLRERFAAPPPDAGERTSSAVDPGARAVPALALERRRGRRWKASASCAAMRVNELSPQVAAPACAPCALRCRSS